MISEENEGEELMRFFLGYLCSSQEDPGLTPRLCEGLFSRIDENQEKEKTYRVSVR